MDNYIKEKEVWKDVKDFGGYKVSNNGRVRSLDRYVVDKNGKRMFYNGIYLKQHVDKDGYLRVQLNKEGNGYNVGVHRLVLLAFVPNPENKPQVNHKNGIKNDNRLENLEWCTNSENQLHAIEIGLVTNFVIPDNTGISNGRAKLTESDVKTIRELYATGKYHQKELANMFGIHQTGISGIILRKTWRSVIE